MSDLDALIDEKGEHLLEIDKSEAELVEIEELIKEAKSLKDKKMLKSLIADRERILFEIEELRSELVDIDERIEEEFALA